MEVEEIRINKRKVIGFVKYLLLIDIVCVGKNYLSICCLNLCYICDNNSFSYKKKKNWFYGIVKRGFDRLYIFWLDLW